MRLILIIIYLAFISLGLPDSLLGSAWPAMHLDFNSTIKFAGVIFFAINFGTIISSLCTNRIIYLFGTAKVTAFSILISAISLYLFSISQNVWVLVLLALPFGLAGGSIDAALNNFVALNLKSKHMNYLHSFWGVGASIGPLILAAYIAQQNGWRFGYALIASCQFLLAVFVFSTLSNWKKHNFKSLSKKIEPYTKDKSLQPNTGYISNIQAIKIKGVKYQLAIMFCYCSLEACTGLWAATFLITQRETSIPEAAFWVSLFYIGITVGRFISGALTQKIKETTLVRIGLLIILLSVLLIFIPNANLLSQIALLFIGFGCAPIYPNTVHLTPTRFGQNASQAVIGMSMASAYIGVAFIAPLFGWFASIYSLTLLPLALLLFVITMLFFSEKLNRLNHT